MADPVSRPIVSGMDVCDVGGDKIGTVAVVHRSREHVLARGMPDESLKVRGEILEVKTGLLGLGKHLHVPMSAV
jgi:hypothetical protein